MATIDNIMRMIGQGQQGGTLPQAPVQPQATSPMDHILAIFGAHPAQNGVAPQATHPVEQPAAPAPANALMQPLADVTGLGTAAGQSAPQTQQKQGGALSSILKMFAGA